MIRRLSKKATREKLMMRQGQTFSKKIMPGVIGNQEK